MKSTDRNAAPVGLPLLQAGAHLMAEDGACLMEYVSVLSGSTFSDHPRCTDPTLATVARLVNDSCTDAGRQQLTRFAPALAGASPVDARGTAAIVRATVRATHRAAGDTAGLRRDLRRAQRRYDRVTGAGPVSALARKLDLLYRQGAGRRRLEDSVAALRALAEPQRDPALHAALAAAITAVSPERRTSVHVMADPEVEPDVIPRGRDVVALVDPG
jgi:hypothetical protein